MDPSGGDPRRAALIDRSAERAWLNVQVQEARRGLPHLALLVGEAGIGKSRLARDLVAGLQGSRLVVTRSRESPAGAFAPFRTTLFPWLEDLAAEQGERPLRDDLRRLDASDDLAERNHRFLSRVATLTIELARREFLTILLDDIHWSDPLSFELIEFIAAHATDAALSGPVPLLVVCTSRPPTDDALRARLERLEREPTTSRLDLEGLGLFDLTELARRHGHDQLRQREVAALADATGGNPLFAEAILRTDPMPERLRLPVHIRDAVATPLAALAEPDRHLLDAASCLDDEFDDAVLATVLDRESGAIREDLHRLERAGILDTGSTGWEFTHPLYQRIVYDDLSPATREAFHLRIVDHHRAVDTPIDPRVIAHHLLEAGPLVSDAQLLPAVTTAGDLEFSSGNWTRAATHYSLVLDRTPSTAVEPATRAAMLHRLGRALVFVGEFDEGMAAFDEAAALWRAAGDDESHLHVLVSRARAQVGSGRPGTTIDDEGLQAALRSIEAASPHIAAVTLAQLSQTRWNAGDLDTAVAHADGAIQVAAEVTAPHRAEGINARVMAHLTKAMVGWTRFDLPDALGQLEVAAAHCTDASDPGMQVGPGNRLPINLVWTGDLHEAARTATAALGHAETIRYTVESGLPLTALGMVDLLRGDPGRAVERFERARRADQLTGYRWSTIFALPSLSVAWDLLTRPDEAALVLDQLDERMGPTSSWTRAARILHTADRIRRVGSADGHRGGDVTAIGLQDDERVSVGTAGLAAACVELADASGRPDLADGAVAVLAAAQDRGLVYIGGVGILLDRSLGRARALAGDIETAVRDLETALRRATADGAALEIARGARDLAATLHQRDGNGDHDRAAQLSRRHHDLLESLGLVHLQPLAPAGTTGGGDPAREGTHTQIVVFADVSGSTRLTQEMGDEVYTNHLRSSLDAIRTIVAACDGRVINHTGDGFLLTFDSAARAIDCALRSHDVLRSHPLDFHFGIHAGDVVEVDGNIFGATVNTAARLCDQATAGETVVSELARQLAAGVVGLRFEDRGMPALKGVVHPLRLFAVHRDDA